MTLVSVFAPLLMKFSVNVGAGWAGTVLVVPVWSVVPPTLTELSAWPWGPGASLPPWAVGVGALSSAATNDGVSHDRLGRNCPWLIGSPLAPPAGMLALCS